MKKSISTKIKELDEHLGVDGIEPYIEWVVNRYAQEGSAWKSEDPDRAAFEIVSVPDEVKDGIEAASPVFIEVFNAYFMLFESADYKTLVANLRWENEVIKQLMAKVKADDMDLDKKQRAFSLGCDLAEKSIEIRKRNKSLQEHLLKSGSITDLAIKKKSNGAESVADQINQIRKNGTSD